MVFLHKVDLLSNHAPGLPWSNKLSLQWFSIKNYLPAFYFSITSETFFLHFSAARFPKTTTTKYNFIGGLCVPSTSPPVARRQHPLMYWMCAFGEHRKIQLNFTCSADGEHIQFSFHERYNVWCYISGEWRIIMSGVHLAANFPPEMIILIASEA